jgi:hypothetical protein
MEQDHEGQQNDVEGVFGVKDLTDDEKKYATSVREAIIHATTVVSLQQVVDGKNAQQHVLFGWGIAAALVGQIIELRRRIVTLEKRSQ